MTVYLLFFFIVINGVTAAQARNRIDWQCGDIEVTVSVVKDYPSENERVLSYRVDVSGKASEKGRAVTFQGKFVWNPKLDTATYSVGNKVVQCQEIREPSEP
jgi:hypothetical protein